jgi:hypothetical protein
MSDKNFKVKNGLDASGAVTITQPTTSTVPLTILANTLATGSNLLEVKRPDGTVRFAVGNDGALTVNSNISFNGGSMAMYPGNSGQTALTVFGQTNQSVANLIVRAATGQSGNLQEWRDQNGNLAVSIGADFALRGISGGFFGTASGNIVGTNYLGVKGWAANHIPFVVQGVSSQTGDLTRWVDSSANTLAKVDASGSITAVDLTLSGNLTVNGTTTNLNSTNLIIEDKNIIIADVATPTDTTADGAGITIKGATDKTFNWVQSTGRFTSSEPIQSSAFVSTYVYASQIGSTVIGTATLNTNSDTGGVLINTAGVANKGLIVKGATSQTANLQEWQDSSGNILAAIRNDGVLRVSQIISKENYSSYLSFASGSPIQVNPLTAGTVGLIVKGVASQTANLQEWQDSSGTVKASIRSSGGLSLNNANSIRLHNTANTDYASLWMDNGSGGTNLYVKTNYPVLMGDIGVDTGASLTVATQSVSQLGQVIRGISSQTADLQQWQNSTGTVLTKVNSIGRMTINSNVDAGGAALYVFQPNGGYGVRVLGSGTAGAALWVDTVAGGVGAIIRGAASQTANLQEWQNSAGSVLLNVDSTGSLDIGAGSNNIWKIKNQTSTVMEWQPGQGFCFFPYGSSNKPLTIKGTVSQSANLTEWRNSAETVLASISPTGKLTSAVDASINGMTIGLGGGNVGSNVAFGQGALASNVSGQNNTAIGFNALSSSTSTFNVAIGGSALAALTTGGTNVALGVLAMRHATTADSAVAIGYSAAGATTTGGYFVAIGAGALGANITGGSDTVAIGYAALNQATATSLTTAVGSGAGYALTTGTQNTYLGRVADGVTTGSNNMMLGYSATASSATVSNEITLGNSSITRFRIPGIGLNITSNSTVNTASAATVGLIVKGAASQTANLQEWQDSAGNVLSSISSLGNITLGGGKLISFSNGTVQKINLGYSGNYSVGVDDYTTVLTADNNAFNGRVGIRPHSATYGTGYVSPIELYANGSIKQSLLYTTNVGLTVKGAASQTADLQQWQDSAGTVLSGIGPNGRIFAQGKTGNTDDLLYLRRADNSVYMYVDKDATLRGNFSIFINQNAPIDSQAFFWSGTSTRSALGASGTVSTNPTFYVKASTSQTSNLTEWQNSFGSAVAKIDSNAIFNSLNAGSGADSYSSIIIGGRWIRNEARLGLSRFGVTTGEWHMATDPDNSAIAITDSQVGVFATSTTLPLFTVKGMASQTANLQEWQNSAGTVLAKVTSAGDINIDISQGGSFHAQASGGQVGDYNLIKMSQVSTQKTTLLTTVVSGGNTEFSLKTLIGTLTTTLKIDKDSLVGIGKNNTSPLAQIDVRPQSSSTIGAIIRGAASQTANLQEWQNSTGTVLTRIGSDGAIYRGAMSIDSYGAIYTTETVAIGATMNQRFATGGLTIINRENASAVILGIKGVASQTGDLTQWRNSSDAVIAKIDSSGALTITNASAASSLITVNGVGGGQFSVSAYGGISTNAGFQSIGSSSYFGGYGGASNVVLYVGGASGQTGDLQRWTNFAGTTLAKVDSLGNFTATSKSFDIAHPTKENMRLRYGSLEGPENGVYIRGTVESNIIELPEYWTGLVHEDSITASLTSVGSAQNIYVEKIENNKIYIGGNLEKAFFTVYGERKDIDKLTVEY